MVAAGDGKTDNDEVIEDEGALRRVRKAIADHPQRNDNAICWSTHHRK